MLNYNSLLNGIKQLAKSQGLYGRMLEGMEEQEEMEGQYYIDQINQILIDNDIRDLLDFIMYIES